MWIHSRQPRLHLREERAGRRGGGAGGGGRGALLPAPSPGRADASRAPRTRKEGCGSSGSGRLARSGGATAALACPRSPPRPSALGLFHWRMLPKMVICVRGRECGFPRFRVTWRERDSLARSQARRGLPPPPLHTHTHTPPWKGARGGAPESCRAGLGAGFQKIITVLKSETGSSVRRHRQAGSRARRAARREGAATRGRRRPLRRRPLQRAPWARRVPAPPCGLALAGRPWAGLACLFFPRWLAAHCFPPPSILFWGPTINLLGVS